MTLHFFPLVLTSPYQPVFLTMNKQKCKWAYNGKITFEKNNLKNSYSHEVNKRNQPAVFSNCILVACTDCQKHPRMYLDSKRNLNQYIKRKNS